MWEVKGWNSLKNKKIVHRNRFVDKFGKASYVNQQWINYTNKLYPEKDPKYISLRAKRSFIQSIELFVRQELCGAASTLTREKAGNKEKRQKNSC